MNKKFLEAAKGLYACRKFHDQLVAQGDERAAGLADSRDECQRLLNRAQSIQSKADSENRDLTADELAEVELAIAEINEILDKPLPRLSPETFGKLGSGRPASVPPSGAAGSDGTGPTFDSIFPRAGNESYGFVDCADFFRAVAAGGVDPRLGQMTAATGQIEGTPSLGGFLVPASVQRRIINAALQKSVLLQRVDVLQMATQEVTAVGPQDTDHSDSPYGGLAGTWYAEAATATYKTAKFRGVKLIAKKLAIFAAASRELVQDGVNFNATLEEMLTNSASWYLDRAILQGSGAGEPLGVLNGNGLVSISKETGQAASTILYENLVSMYSRLHPSHVSGALWLANPSTLPQLLSVTLGVGTSGVFHPLISFADGSLTLLGLPLVLTEHANALGTAGDIVLLQPQAYLLGMRQEFLVETSPHVKFDTDEISWRITCRCDGAPKEVSTVTLADGSTTVGAAVVIETRS